MFANETHRKEKAKQYLKKPYFEIYTPTTVNKWNEKKRRS